MKLDDLLRRVDQLIGLGDAALASRYRITNSSGDFLRSELVAEFRSAGLSFLEKTFGAQHPYYADFDKHTSAGWPNTIESARGVFRAVRNEIEGGWLTSTRGLVSAEIFGDFLEMADHLLQEGYKDPAAVLVGGILEERLRQLAARRSIPLTQDRGGVAIPRKADALNADLGKSGAYNMLQQKTITAWLDLRNRAAHADYSSYSADHVRSFLEGIRQFLLVTNE